MSYSQGVTTWFSKQWCHNPQIQCSNCMQPNPFPHKCPFLYHNQPIHLNNHTFMLWCKLVLYVQPVCTLLFSSFQYYFTEKVYNNLTFTIAPQITVFIKAKQCTLFLNQTIWLYIILIASTKPKSFLRCISVCLSNVHQYTLRFYQFLKNYARGTL